MTAGSQDRVIRIVAAVTTNARGEALLVRKRGTFCFMLPGGKRDRGETAVDGLAREIEEELGCRIDRASCRTLGTFRAPAANEPGFTVEAELFAVSLIGEPAACGEIEEVAWLDPKCEPPYPLAPLARRHALPLARYLRSKERNPAR